LEAVNSDRCCLIVHNSKDGLSRSAFLVDAMRKKGFLALFNRRSPFCPVRFVGVFSFHSNLKLLVLQLQSSRAAPALAPQML
jgi:hypothetical protein